MSSVTDVWEPCVFGRPLPPLHTVAECGDMSMYMVSMDMDMDMYMSMFICTCTCT